VKVAVLEGSGRFLGFEDLGVLVSNRRDPRRARVERYENEKSEKKAVKRELQMERESRN
jgi:hypothetical protein